MGITLLGPRFPYRRPCDGCGPSVGALGSDGTSVTAIGLGRITASAIAAEVTRITGTPTTPATIVARAKASNILDPDSGGTSDERTLIALARGMFNGENPASVVAAVAPAVRAAGGSDQLAALISASVGVSGTEALAAVGRAAVEMGRSMLTVVGTGAMGFLESVLGDEAAHDLVSAIGSAAGVAIERVAQAAPVLGAMFNLASALSAWVTSLFDVQRGKIVPATQWAVDAKNLYVWLCESRGLAVPAKDSAWICTFNPFFQEVFLSHGDADNVLTPFRALDASNYTVGGRRLPDWREQFASDVALAYVQMAGTDAAPGRTAEKVTGCECGSGGIITPWWWSQGRPEWRAAMVAGCYVGIGCGCMKGLGTWNGTGGRAVANPYDDPRWYNDVELYYDLGYSPDLSLTTWWSGWDRSRRRIRLYSPATPPYPTTRTGTRCDFRNEYDRTTMHDWLETSGAHHDLGTQPGNRFLPKRSPPSPGRYGKSRTGGGQFPVPTEKPGGPGAIAVVGAVGVAALLGYALLS